MNLAPDLPILLFLFRVTHKFDSAHFFDELAVFAGDCKFRIGRQVPIEVSARRGGMLSDLFAPFERSESHRAFEIRLFVGHPKNPVNGELASAASRSGPSPAR